MVQVRAMNHVIDKGQALYWGTSEWTAQVRPRISSLTRADWASARPNGEHGCPSGMQCRITCARSVVLRSFKF